MPLVLFDLEHSGNLCKVFLVLLDIALVALRSVDGGSKVANTHLQLAHFPGLITLEFFHILL